MSWSLILTASTREQMIDMINDAQAPNGNADQPQELVQPRLDKLKVEAKELLEQINVPDDAGVQVVMGGHEPTDDKAHASFSVSISTSTYYKK